MNSLTTAERLHGLLGYLANAFRSDQLHEGAPGVLSSHNQFLSAQTRTKLAMIEDISRSATERCGPSASAAAGGST